MTTSWIDRLATGLNREGSRRTALQALGTSALAAGAGLAAVHETKGKSGKKKKKHKQTCPTPSTCPTPPACPSCRAGENFCDGHGTPPCGDGCRCAMHLVGGATTCAVVTGSIQCGECASDADCGAFGAGAFCADGSGEFCCDAPGVGFCALPCPA